MANYGERRLVPNLINDPRCPNKYLMFLKISDLFGFARVGFW